MSRNDRLASPIFNLDTFIEHRRINEAVKEIGSLHTSNATAEQQVLRLLELDREQGHEIAKLQAVVYTLMQLLAESGAVDPATMNQRIHGAVEALQANPTWDRMRGV